ncbi:hypothetical protein ACHAXT_009031 [Thalassiosira profunda]
MPPAHALLGISPPAPGLATRIARGLPSIDGVALRWGEDTSSTQDAERNNAETLLLAVTAVDAEGDDDEDAKEVAPEAIVARVDELLNGVGTKGSDDDCNKGEQRRPPQYFVELWATSPAPLPLRPIDSAYDELLAISCERWDFDASQLMTQYGAVLQTAILDEEEVAALRTMVDQAIANVDALLAIHRPELDVGKDSFVFLEIASRNVQRFDLRLDECEGAADFVERCILNKPQVQSLLTSCLGERDEIDFDLSVVYSRPGAVDQRWHADGEHIQGASELDPPYAVCLFLPLIDLDKTVGYTQFWPGSHKSKHLVGFGPVAELTRTTYDGICKSGDGVWYDYRLLHRGMRNISDQLRPVVQVIFKKRWYVEKRNYGTESIVPSDDP